jgi:hypothetical protein
VNLEKGFRRLTWVVSGSILFVMTFLNFLQNNSWYERFFRVVSNGYVPDFWEWFVVAMPFGMAMVPWVVFLGSRWIVRGFRSAGIGQGDPPASREK